MTTVKAQDMQRDFAGYLHRVAAGETLVILENEQPVAELKPLPVPPAEPKGLRPYGLAKGQFTVPDDFDDPLPEDILRLFEGGDER